MKRCPICNQVFSDENIYCLNDGTALENLQTPASQYETPTQVLPSVQTKIIPQKAENKGIYWIVGALSLVILALAFVIYTLVSKSEPTSPPNTEKSENTGKNKDSADSKKGDQNTSENKEINRQTPPITNEAVRNLLDRWEKSQDARNFNAYKSCYSPQFLGIKRTKSGSESRMNYAQWLNDRQKMLKNTVDVEIQNLEITIEGETANVRFTQQFQSANYQDEGQKILKIKMFDDGAKIIYEELKYSY